MKVKGTTQEKQQRGAFVLIIAGSISVVLSLAAYVFFTSSIDLVEAELQAAADAAAIAGAETFDGSRDSFNKAVDAVQAVLDRYQASGGKGDNALSLYSEGCSSNPAGNEFDCTAVKNLIVKIERGMWFPKAAGSEDEEEGLSFLSMEGSFVDNYPGIPQAVLANSVKIEITRPSYGAPLALSWLGAVEQEVSVTATARAGLVGTVCTAPFAIPVCALLDGNGDFHKERMCAGDRIFTQADRYCPEGAGADCDRFPSFEYGVCSPEIFDIDKHFTYTGTPEELGQVLGDPEEIDRYGPTPVGYASAEDRPDEYLLSKKLSPSKFNKQLPISSAGFGCGSVLKPNFYGSDGAVVGNSFNGELWQQHEDDLYSPPFFRNHTDSFGGTPSSSLSDGFGVVGLPGSAAQGLSTIGLRNKIGVLLGNSMGSKWSVGSETCSIKTDVGDTFQILEAGLENAETFDDLVWQQITNGGIGINESHPAAIDTVVGTIKAHRIKGLLSSNTPFRGDGLCQSKRIDLAIFHHQNFKDDAWPWAQPFMPFLNPISKILPDGVSLKDHFNSLSSNPKAGFWEWPDGVIPHDDNPYGGSGQEYSYQNISGQRIAFEVAASPTAVGVAPGSPVTDNTPVWKVRVPVLADISPLASRCEGITGATVDPILTNSGDIRIVGFVDTVIYDVDISDPPANFGGPLEQVIFSGDVTAANEFRMNLQPPFPAVTPGDPGPPGWYFNDGTDPIACNLVRGRISCNSEFIATSEETTRRIATLVD